MGEFDMVSLDQEEKVKTPTHATEDEGEGLSPFEAARAAARRSPLERSHLMTKKSTEKTT